MKADWCMGSIHRKKSWTKSLGIVPENEGNRLQRNRWRKRPRTQLHLWERTDLSWVMLCLHPLQQRTHFPAPFCSKYTGAHILNNMRKNLQDIFWHCPQCKIKVQPYSNCKWKRVISNWPLKYNTIGLLYTCCHLLHQIEPILSSFENSSSFPRRKVNLLALQDLDIDRFPYAVCVPLISLLLTLCPELLFSVYFILQWRLLWLSHC